MHLHTAYDVQRRRDVELERGLATASILHKTKSKEQHLPSCEM